MTMNMPAGVPESVLDSFTRVIKFLQKIGECYIANSKTGGREVRLTFADR